MKLAKIVLRSSAPQAAAARIRSTHRARPADALSVATLTIIYENG